MSKKQDKYEHQLLEEMKVEFPNLSEEQISQAINDLLYNERVAREFMDTDTYRSIVEQVKEQRSNKRKLQMPVLRKAMIKKLSAILLSGSILAGAGMGMKHIESVEKYGYYNPKENVSLTEIQKSEKQFYYESHPIQVYIDKQFNDNQRQIIVNELNSFNKKIDGLSIDIIPPNMDNIKEADGYSYVYIMYDLEGEHGNLVTNGYRFYEINNCFKDRIDDPENGINVIRREAGLIPLMTTTSINKKTISTDTVSLDTYSSTILIGNLFELLEHVSGDEKLMHYEDSYLVGPETIVECYVDENDYLKPFWGAGLIDISDTGNTLNAKIKNAYMGLLIPNLCEAIGMKVTKNQDIHSILNKDWQESSATDTRNYTAEDLEYFKNFLSNEIVKSTNIME